MASDHSESYQTAFISLLKPSDTGGVTQNSDIVIMRLRQKLNSPFPQVIVNVNTIIPTGGKTVKVSILPKLFKKTKHLARHAAREEAEISFKGFRENGAS